MGKTRRHNPEDLFTDSEDSKHGKNQYRNNKHKRGQHNPKYGHGHKNDTPGGLEGHAENEIGHKRAGHSDENTERRYN